MLGNFSQWPTRSIAFETLYAAALALGRPLDAPPLFIGLIDIESRSVRHRNFGTSGRNGSRLPRRIECRAGDVGDRFAVDGAPLLVGWDGGGCGTTCYCCFCATASLVHLGDCVSERGNSLFVSATTSLVPHWRGDSSSRARLRRMRRPSHTSFVLTNGGLEKNLHQVSYS